MPLPCQILFVYGTLLRRSAHPMARLLSERGAFLGEARIRGKLYNLGRFPGLTPAVTEDWVFGDLYDLGEQAAHTLAELDRYEGDESTPDALFERQMAEVAGAEGRAVQAWVYWFQGAVKEETRIISGRYLR